MNEYNYVIESPIWATRSVGLDTDKVKFWNYIWINYKKKDGKYLYPDPFFLQGKNIKEYPAMKRKGKTLHIVPIAELGMVVGGFNMNDPRKEIK